VLSIGDRQGAIQPADNVQAKLTRQTRLAQRGRKTVVACRSAHAAQPLPPA